MSTFALGDVLLSPDLPVIIDDRAPRVIVMIVYVRLRSAMTVDDPSGTVAIFKLWPKRWGLGLYADDRGLTYRQLSGTSRFDWAEISYFEDGSWADGQPGGVHWVLHIVLCTGRKVPVYCKPTSETLAAVVQVAARYGIPARLAGEVPKPLVQVVSKRRWRARD